MTHIPSSIFFEVTSVCNLRCKGCAIHGPERCVKRPVGSMKEDIWRQAVSEMGGWSTPVNIATHGAGEPLLHPQLKDIIVFSKSFPNLTVGFLTNGMLLDRDWSEFIVTHGVDWIAFSIDSVSPDKHRILRKNSDLSVIEKNLSALLDVKKVHRSDKPSVSINMVAYDEVMDERDAMLERWLDQVDNITISHYRYPPCSKKWPRSPGDRRPCFLLWMQMVIAWDGQIGLCCEDFDIDYPFGRVGEKPLLDIWNSDDYNFIRKLHRDGKYDAVQLCSHCDSWADDIAHESIDEKRKYRITRRASQTGYQLID